MSLRPVIELLVPAEPDPQSLERFVAAQLQARPELGLTMDYLTIRQWIKQGHIEVLGTQAKASRYVEAGQKIQIRPPAPAPHPANAEDLPLPLRYLDADLVVVAKPAGMATHPGPGWWHGSCVNALLYAVPDWPGVGGIAGPGIVHRLDRDTSGMLIFARSDRAHQALLQAIREHRIQRRYLAWVVGELSGSGSIQKSLARDPQDPRRMSVQTDGKAALTHYQVRHTQAGNSLLELQLATGRQHQIRVHLADLGHPVWGDQVYGTAGPFMALHAAQLIFRHPISQAWLEFNEPAPACWQTLGELPTEF